MRQRELEPVPDPRIPHNLIGNSENDQKPINKGKDQQSFVGRNELVRNHNDIFPLETIKSLIEEKQKRVFWVHSSNNRVTLEFVRSQL